MSELSDGVQWSSYTHNRPVYGSVCGVKFDGCTRLPRFQCKNTVPARFVSFVDDEIASLLKNGAIEPSFDDSHVCGLTIEPTKPRLCIDSRPVNLFVKDLDMSLPHLGTMLPLFSSNCVMFKVDDAKGYFHVLIAQDSRRFFTFRWRGKLYRYCVLPFGYKASPYIFCRLSDAFARFASRMCKCLIRTYIDDSVAVVYSPPDCTRPPLRVFTEALTAVTAFLQLKTKAGFFVNYKPGKSFLFPNTVMPVLGILVDSTDGSFAVPETKREKFVTVLSNLLQENSWSLRVAQSIFGKLNAYMCALPPVRPFAEQLLQDIRDLQSLSASRSRHLSPLTKFCLQFWLRIFHHDLPWGPLKRLWLRPACLTLYCDASLYAMGAVFVTAGVVILEWSHVFTPDDFAGFPLPQELSFIPPLPASYRQDIFACELLSLCKALTFACTKFPHLLRNRFVEIRTDNTNTLSAVNKLHHRDTQLLRYLAHIAILSCRLNFSVRASYISSAENPADGPSRPVDVQLDPRAFRYVIANSREIPAIDWMATSKSVQWVNSRPLPFVSRFFDPDAVALNALACDWRTLPFSSTSTVGYCFPPRALLNQVSALVKSQRPRVILVVWAAEDDFYFLPSLFSDHGCSVRTLYLVRNGVTCQPVSHLGVRHILYDLSRDQPVIPRGDLFVLFINC